jgi:leader peptidase (prepilin peptidase)/N-methyltransferase
MSPTWLLAPLVFAAGTAAGSFAATAGLRSSRAEQVMAGRSHCDGCGLSLSYMQTLPLVSYVAAGGACPACRARIDLVHPFGEAAGGVVLLGAFVVGEPIRAVAVGLLGFVLIAAAAVDAKSQRLPDLLTMLAASLCALLAWTKSSSAGATGLVASVIAMGILEILRRLSRARNGEPGLGFGDVKLVGALALWIGADTPWMVVAAASLGLVATAILKPAEGRLPFGPAIAASAWSLGLMRETNLWPT